LQVVGASINFTAALTHIAINFSSLIMHASIKSNFVKIFLICVEEILIIWTYIFIYKNKKNLNIIFIKKIWAVYMNCLYAGLKIVTSILSKIK
jgi:aromatic ring hydroxylase